jgi:antitoxin component HigA of HigAB toxin-antitoxin module
MIDKIRSQAQYDAIMHMIEKYIQKATKLGGFHALTKQDETALHQLTLLANDYEKKQMLPGRVQPSLNLIIQNRLEEMNITQSKLSELLNTTASKISKILSGKQEPDAHFLKAVHEKLGIDGNVILEAI